MGGLQAQLTELRVYFARSESGVIEAVHIGGRLATKAKVAAEVGN